MPIMFFNSMFASYFVPCSRVWVVVMGMLFQLTLGELPSGFGNPKFAQHTEIGPHFTVPSGASAVGLVLISRRRRAWGRRMSNGTSCKMK